MPLWCTHFVYVRGDIVYCRLSGVCVHSGQEKNEISSMIQACVFYLQGLVYAFGRKKGENYDGKLRDFHWQERLTALVKSPVRLTALALQPNNSNRKAKALSSEDRKVM